MIDKEMDGAALFTVTVVVPMTPETFAAMTELPTESAVNRPPEVIVPTPGVPLVHDAAMLVSVVPLARVALVVNCWVWL